MALIVAKIAILAVLVILTFGVFPDRRRGGIIAIATCASQPLLSFISSRLRLTAEPAKAALKFKLRPADCPQAL
jgi:hypothetical protein